MIRPELQQAIVHVLGEWNKSEPSQRVVATDTFAQSHGLEPYKGLTIPDFIDAALTEYTEWLIEHPEYLKPDEEEEEDPEAMKLEVAKLLQAEMTMYWFGFMDPRWHKANKKLNLIISTFKK